MIRKRIIHPVLFGLFAGLHYYSHGATEMRLPETLLIFILAIILPYMATEILARIKHDISRAALLVTAVIALLTLYALLVAWLPAFIIILDESRISWNLILLPLWCGLGYYAWKIIYKSSRVPVPGSRTLNWAGIVLVIGQLIFIAGSAIVDSNRSGCLDLAGDANNDGRVNVADVVFLTNYIFRNGPVPDCPEEGNINGDAAINVGDIVWLTQYIFKGGPAPRPSQPLEKR